MKKVVVLFLFISVEIAAQHSVNPHLFGFRTSTAFTFFEMKDTSFVNKVIELSPNILSFPGGLGNFYHLNAPAYGLNVAEIEKHHTGTKPKVANTFNSIANKKGHQRNYIYDFIELVQKTNAQVIYNANVLTADPQEILDIITTFKDYNIELIGVELGGELTNRTYKHIIDVDKYILLSEMLSYKIKAQFPDLKIIVVAAPVHSLKRHTRWNEKLANEHYYDGIVTHSYAKVTKGKDVFGKMIDEQDEGKNKQEVFDLYKERTLNYFSQLYPNEIQEFSRIFKNKPIWITEWNLQMSKITANTILQGLFVSQYLMELTTNQALQNIELTTFHNLAGRTLSGSMIMMKNNQSQLLVTYTIMKMIHEVFTDSNFVATKQELAADCFVYTFVTNTQKIQICINWSNKEKKLKIIPEQNVSAQEFYGNDLFSTSKNGETTYNRLYNTKTTACILKPYSITLVKYNE
jgi:hypothetical protein|tara:strand:- start:6441 stop:7826 length:1386 start_codon:yes stop_codon:yes gene_type:complete